MESKGRVTQTQARHAHPHSSSEASEDALNGDVLKMRHSHTNASAGSNKKSSIVSSSSVPICTTPHTAPDTHSETEVWMWTFVVVTPVATLKLFTAPCASKDQKDSPSVTSTIG